MLLHAKTTKSENDVLFNQSVYLISGTLDPTVYRRAWQLVVERHPALRTMFVWQDSKKPVQIVREQITLPWIEEDWRSLTASDQESGLDKLLTDDRIDGFDLLHPPLMRLYLIQVADDRHWLIWSSHHLVIDRWCIGIIFNEVRIAYEAYAAHEYPLLPPAPRYRDYIAWLAERDEEATRSYWHDSMCDVAARLLPLQDRIKEIAWDLNSVKLAVSGNDLAGLRGFAVENDLTMGTIVNAAWAVVLSAITGVHEVLFGLTVSGRPAELPAIGSAVGCFINNVPLRVLLNDDSQVMLWLQALQDKQLALQSYEYASPAQIQEWSGIRSSGPLFDTLVVLQAPVNHAVPNGLDMQFLRGGMQTGYLVSLGVVPDKQSLRLTLTYDRRRVPMTMVDTMVSILQGTLQALPQMQESLLSDLLANAAVEELREPLRSVEEIAVASQQLYTPPRTAIERVMAQAWADVLGQPRIGVEDKFFDLGGDSISALRLFTVVQQRLDKQLPVTLILQNPSVAQMAAEVGNNVPDAPVDPVLLPINENGQRPPFFYAHGVFGDVSSMTNMIPILEADQPIYGLQALGLHPRYEPDRTIEEMATHYIEAIGRVQPSGPYFLGGFCFGGVLAYEIGRQLEQLGERTALLAIIEGAAPRIFHSKRPIYDPRRLQVIQQSAPYWIRGYKEFGGWRLRERIRSRLDSKPNRQQSANDWVDTNAEFDNLADYAASRPEIQFQLREINNRAVDEYVPQPYGGQVTLFRARSLHIGHALFGEIDPERGWSNLARGGVSVRYVHGTHVGILKQPYATELATQLVGALREAQAKKE